MIAKKSKAGTVKKKATKQLPGKGKPKQLYLVTVGGTDWYCGPDKDLAKNLYRDLINLIQDNDLFIDVEVRIP